MTDLVRVDVKESVVVKGTGDAVTVTVTEAAANTIVTPPDQGTTVFPAVIGVHSGVAGGDLEGSYPNPVIKGTVLGALVALTPLTTARNVIVAGGAGVTPITVKAAAAQTADLQQWQESTGATLLAVSASGALQFGSAGDTNLYRSAAGTLKTDGAFQALGDLSAGIDLRLNRNDGVDPALFSTVAGRGIRYLTGAGAGTHAFTGRVYVVPRNATDVGLKVQGAASQTADLQRWQNSAGTVLASVNPLGELTASTYKFTGAGQAFLTANELDLYDGSTFAFQLGPFSGSTYAFRVKHNKPMQVTTRNAANAADVQRILLQHGDLPTQFEPNSAAGVAMSVKGLASQTADLQQWQNSAGTVLASIKPDGALALGASATQTTAKIRTRGSGNHFEWGNANPNGFGCAIGAMSASGIPFIAFNAEQGTTDATYRTRGLQGAVCESNLAGGFRWGNVPLANADDQSLTQTLVLTSAGTLQFGSAADTNLYRGDANQLKTDDSFWVNNTTGLAVGIAPNTTSLVNLPASATVAAGGIGWGTDTNLYRSAAGILKTDGTFRAQLGSANKWSLTSTSQNWISTPPPNVTATTDLWINGQTDVVFGRYNGTDQQGTEVGRFQSLGFLTVPGGYRVAGVALASTHLSDSAALARLAATQTFTAMNVFAPAAASTTGLRVLSTGSAPAVSNKALTTDVATLTTATTHGFIAGRSVTVSGVDATFNGTYTVASVPTTTTFTYAKTAADVLSQAATGTATAHNIQTADLQQWLDNAGSGLARITATGVFAFGATADANLYRSAAATLKTDGGLHAVQPVRVGPATGRSVQLNAGDPSQSGYVEFTAPDGIRNGYIGYTPNAGGINYNAERGGVHAFSGSARFDSTMLFGSASDTNLYRSAAGILKTDGQVQAAGLVYSNVSTANQVVIGYGPAIGPGISFGSGADTNLYRNAAGVLKTDGALIAATTIQAAIGLSKAVEIGVDRLGGGQASINFGATQDTNLYRSAANTLKTDSNIRIASPRNLFIEGDGTQGIVFGSAGDANLYRAAAGVLKTDGVFNAIQLFANPGGVSQVKVGDNSGTAAVVFGASGDTNLYRSAAGVLKTDGAFQAGSLAIGTAALASTHLADTAALARLAGPQTHTGIHTFSTAIATAILTALPASPVDGQEINFQTAAMATKGIVWRLRYRAASGSAYKWEFVGGSPLSAAEDLQYGALTNTTAAVQGTTMNVTTPLAGEYLCGLTSGGALGSTSGAEFFTCQFRVGAADQNTNSGQAIQCDNSGSQSPQNMSRQGVPLTVGAGVVIALSHFMSAGGTSYFVRGRMLTVAPVRVG